jgi:AhpD family alkylhydroperoxidase
MLLYLACSYANRCAFCIAANTPGAHKTGVTERELQALKEEWDDEFSESERAAIRYARELTRTGDAMATRAALPEHFRDEQIAEMTLVICTANFTNRLNNGLQIHPEA